MIYDNYRALCKRKRVSPSAAAVAAGISKSTVSKWKTNPDANISGSVLKRLADYFEMPVHEVLIALEGTKKEPTSDEADERDEITAEYVMSLFEKLTDEEKKAVFSRAAKEIVEKDLL